MKLAHNYYVYIVECTDRSYYTGVTNDVDKRVEQHNEGLDPGCYTFKRRPVVLKYYEHFFHIKNAIAWEKQVKGWSRKKKEALFKGDYKTISELAKNHKDKSFDKLRMTNPSQVQDEIILIMEGKDKS